MRNIEQGENITKCQKILAGGGIIAFPTDTVYGLGCDIYSGEAVQRIRALKGRSSKTPFLINVSSRKDIYRYVVSVNVIEEELMDIFWPGPLTIIFEANEAVPESVTAGLSTIGIRIPLHPLTQALLRDVPRGIVSTSINIAGEPPLASSAEVAAGFGGYLDYLLGVNETCSGKPSTIVRINRDKIIIIRPGTCDEQLLEHFEGAILWQNTH